MHVDTMSRSPIGMCLPLDQPPATSPTSSSSHAFPPFPSPESECIPNWLQFDSLTTPTHYPNPYATPVAIPFENSRTSPSCALPCAETLLELDRNPCVDPWEDQMRPLPSFPQSLGRAKRRALDLACITRASATGLHRPYSPTSTTTLHSFSPPPPSGCYGHLSAHNISWAEQVSDNQVVMSQNEGLCMLVESQETYSRNEEDYGNSNVVLDILTENNQQQSYVGNYLCQENGLEGVHLEEEGERGNGGEEELGGRLEQWEETEEEEEEGEEEKAVEEEEALECGRRKKGKRRRRRRRRRKQSNDSDLETATDDTAFLIGEDDGQCSLPSTPTTLICRWSECNAIFGDQSALVRHIEKTHVDARSRGGGGSGGSSGRGCSGSQGSGGSFGEEFACHWHLCPRRTRPFNARYKLLIHMRVHSGDKPNKCPYEGCPKAFSRLENLKIHQRSHTGERPYSCQFPLCPKAFSNSSDRAKHQRTHFDTKPYACQVAGCSKRYTDPSSLRKHVKNHSPKDQSQARRKMKSAEANSSSPSQSMEPKCIPPAPQELSYLPSHIYQDYNSEMSSSSASIKGNNVDQEESLNGVKMEGMSVHSHDTADGDYGRTNNIIEFSNQETEDDLFFDCFQSLESVRPMLNGDKESALTTDLQNAAQFELSLDLDCGDVQQDFLEIGVLEKWGVTGANIVGCNVVDDSLDGEFITIS